MAEFHTCMDCDGTIEIVSPPLFASDPSFYLCASCDHSATATAMEFTSQCLDALITASKVMALKPLDEFLDVLAAADFDSTVDFATVLRAQGKWLEADAEITVTRLKKGEIREALMKEWEERWGLEWIDAVEEPVT